MTAPTSSPAPASPADRRAEIGRAAAALRDGRLVILPTETVYGVFAAATDRAALDRLFKLTGPPSGPDDPLAWHAPDGGAVRDLLALPHPAHRRLMRRLMPGPVTWIIEVSDEAASAVRQSLHPLDGAIVSARTVAVRVPDHALTAAVLREAGIPAVARSIAATGWGSGASVPKGLASAPPDSVGAIIDDGPTRYGRPSTTVRLGRDGAVVVEPGGALEERFVRKQLERTILFVCTGNTCRSPMAAAIARWMLEKMPPSGITTHVRSAGVAATPGYPATPEAVEALRKLEIDMGRHASARVDRSLIAGADAIFTMSREHTDAVLAIDPSAVDRVRTLDPSGRTVADPVGGVQGVYDDAALQIRALLSERLGELDP